MSGIPFHVQKLTHLSLENVNPELLLVSTQSLGYFFQKYPMHVFVYKKQFFWVFRFYLVMYLREFSFLMASCTAGWEQIVSGGWNPACALPAWGCQSWQPVGLFDLVDGWWGGRWSAFLQLVHHQGHTFPNSCKGILLAPVLDVS